MPRTTGGTPETLVGRERELKDLSGLLCGDDAVALVLGMSGAGKTAVLTAMAQSAADQGSVVLSATGALNEQQLPFGVLADLLRLRPDSMDLLRRIAPVGDEDPPPNPLRLRLEVLSWLETTAENTSVLIVVDDVQWCDVSSLSVLGFIARRLRGSGVSFLAACRDGQIPQQLADIPVVPLSPLGETDARRLLRVTAVALDGVALSKVLDMAAGNPLALLELGRAVGTGAPLSALPSSVERAFAQRMAVLPADTRQLLLLAAAGDGDLGRLGRIVDPADLLRRLVPAELASLISITKGKVHFQHPLARAAAYGSGTTEERIHAHQRLAAAHDDDPGRRIWHLAEATIVPDEDVAAALEQEAGRLHGRGANAEAMSTLKKAAELSPARVDRDRRTLDTVWLAAGGGYFDWVIEVGGPLRGQTADPAIRVAATQVVAYAMSQTLRQRDATRAVIDALEQAVDHDPHWGWSSLTTLAVLAYRRGSGTQLVQEWLDRYDQTRSRTPGSYPEIAIANRAWIRAQINPLVRPPDLLETVRTAPVPDYPPSLRATHEMVLGAAAWILDEPRVALVRLGRSVDMQREDSPAKTTNTLIALAQVQVDVGDYDAADQTGRLLVDIAATGRHAYAGEHGLEVRARVAALRGDTDEARQMCEQTLRTLEIGEFAALEANIQVTQSHLAFAEHDPQGAWNALRPLFDPDGEPAHQHISYRELAHYIRMGVQAGMVEALRPVVAVAERRLAAAGPRHRLQLARARALLAAENAEPFHREAITHPLAVQWPFELARAHLEYGSWLRRRQRLTDARAQLHLALAGFERLGVRPWRGLTVTELRAAGVATAEPASSAWAGLTGQEREVVRLAATGMTNREIGASLFLSARTVSTHLYNAFPKLGVTSRMQLRDVVPQDRPGTDPAS